MAYYATELAMPPPVDIGDGAVIQEEMGTGYPTGGADLYYPNSPLPASTVNPAGVPNSPDEFPAIVAAPPGTPFAYAYSFQTWEEKWAAMVPPGVPVVPVTVAANEPYPTA